jgi:transposase
MMPAKCYRVTLESDERAELERLISRGKGAARRLAHARVLLHADSGPEGPGWTDAAIAAAVEVSVPTIERIRQRFVEDGLEAALNPRPPQRVYRRKLDGAAEARLIALACGPPPEGRRCWTLSLLADRLVALGCVESVSYETVRVVLKQTSLGRI